MEIAQTSTKTLAHGQASMPIRGASFGTNQPPDAIRQLIRLWLTDKEADNILSRFQEACIPNRQVFWSGMFREHAQQWADAHGFQTLTTALGPLLYHGDPSPQTQAPARYIHGASIIFAWFVSQGDLVTVLSHPPPLFFHPSGQTFYQLYEEPIIKGKMGNRPVGKIDIAHPSIKAASDFIYQIWPHDNSSLWKKTFGIQDIVLPWRQTKILKPTAQPGANLSSKSLLTSKTPESMDPANTSVAQTTNKVVKAGQQKKKKVSVAIVNQGKSPGTKKSPKSGIASNKQPLVKTAGISDKQPMGSSMREKSKKEKKSQNQNVAIVKKVPTQLNAKQSQKKTATTAAKAKGSKTAAKAKPTIKSVVKKGE
ncbi:hypothetical protein FGADI_1654 [Fusarium gaditjirri]|uniref:Uncharacterized protein n=1 Tax=Fusarium gaditjirri TaxID=282569 RepID=A0A8H4X2B1_9HYPO|nr:hypothetical protein FGADI_1654 [Fusarium gaditjirri]